MPLTHRVLTTVVLATLWMAPVASTVAPAGGPAGASGPGAAPALEGPAATSAPAAASPVPATLSAPSVSAGAPPVPGVSELAVPPRREEAEDRAGSSSRRESKANGAEAPVGVPSRAEMDRYVDQRRREVDAQIRATDPWGQARRDWLEGRRQFRRDALDLFRGDPGVPGVPGSYPWGPLAPYYGLPWSEPTAPEPPARQGMEEFLQNKNRAIEQELRHALPWTPYRALPRPSADSSQDWMLRQNPWAPAP